VPRLPAFDPSTSINRSPHVVILGAGASRASFPSGDANGKKLPVMADLVDCLGLRPLIEGAGFSNASDFEALYDEIATSGLHPSLKTEIESRVRNYFEALEMPDAPTIYDFLVLSLRENDFIATFNWDPFLVKAYLRNQGVAKLPQLLFLHGNVMVGVCPSDRTEGFRTKPCHQCGGPLEPTRLLYPVRQKDYNSDHFIASQWAKLKQALNEGYMLTVFGYGAPATDVEAVELMRQGWSDNPTFDLAEVAIVDIRLEHELRGVWERFLCRTHYSVSADIWSTWLFGAPRRSCESFAMATLQNNPWRKNPYPKFRSLSQLHAWLTPLVMEERQRHFTGDPCLQAEDFRDEVAEPVKRTGTDFLFGWLKMLRGAGLTPPFCVELALKDGAHYNLHSVLSYDDDTRTMVIRIWDLRALDVDDVQALKLRLNEVGARAELASAGALNPRLDWANVRVHYDDISYCIEWHDRIWPDRKIKAEEITESL
jgi:hypothetical protein